jgi:hypothetical protein
LDFLTSRWPVKKTLLRCLGTLQILVGVGAVVSGAMLIADPSGTLLHAPVEMLKGSPFRDFLLPGVILFLVNGVGQLGAGVLSLRMHRSSGIVGAVFGFGLMIWIFVQVSMIGGGHVLQYSYFAAGVVETALAFLVQGHR